MRGGGDKQCLRGGDKAGNRARRGIHAAVGNSGLQQRAQTEGRRTYRQTTDRPVFECTKPGRPDPGGQARRARLLESNARREGPMMPRAVDAYVMRSRLDAECV